MYRDENTGAADLVIDPSNSKILYASLWAAQVAPWEIRSGGSFRSAGGGVFKSTNGEDTWAELSGGLPKSPRGLGRIGLAIAPGRPSRVYALVMGGEAHGVYRSDNGGDTGERVNDERRISGHGPGSARLAVSPDNPE